MTIVPPAIVLVRHGETPWSAAGRFQGAGDPPLSDRGVEQAAAVGHLLGVPEARQSLDLPTTPPLMIRHSPLKRAAATAEAVARRLGSVPRVVDEDLREVGQGAWEGLTHAEVQARWAQEYGAWRRDPAHHAAPGGEQLADAAARAERVFEHLLAALADAGHEAPKDVGTMPASPVPDPWLIVVAHDGILRLILLRALVLGLEHYRSFPFGHCRVTVIEQGAQLELRLHNFGSGRGPS